MREKTLQEKAKEGIGRGRRRTEGEERKKVGRKKEEGRMESKGEEV